MTLFQQTAKWAMRALIVWGAVEATGVLYDAGAERLEAVTRLTGHASAMTRLKTRAHEAETRAHAAEAALSGAAAAPWLVSTDDDAALPEAVARALRQELLDLGAEAPVVDAGDVAALPDATARIVLTATWREQAAASPRVLHGLAQFLPDFAVTRLSLESGDPARVQLALVVTVRPTPVREARLR